MARTRTTTCASLPSFVAIDFETANHYPNSACAVGLVRVERGRIVDRFERLIRPPYRTFDFTHIHGITWHDVADAQSFGELWSPIRRFLGRAQFLAAHNAPFDRRVLGACCSWYRLAVPELPFVCSCRVARVTWRLERYRLSHVAAHLDIPLLHHRAISDAEACAKILLAASKEHGPDHVLSAG